MKKTIVNRMLFVLLLLLSYSGRAYGFLIDDFTQAAGPLSTGGLTDVSTDDPAIFATQRDFGLYAGGSQGTLTAAIANGVLTATSALVRPPNFPAVILDYDGDESLLTCTGGAPCVPSAFLNVVTGTAGGLFDLTDGGINNAFRLRFLEMSGSLRIVVDWALKSSGLLFTSVGLYIGGTPLEYLISGVIQSPTDLTIPFTDITGQLPAYGLDLTQVAWLRFTFVLGPDSFFALDSIDTAVVQASQAITVATPAPPAAPYGAEFSVAATASSGLPVAITTTGVCAGSGSGSATITMTSGTGTCTVHYNQAGNADYDPAPEVTSTTIALADTVTIQRVVFTRIGSVLSVSAASSASPNAALSATVANCLTNAPMRWSKDGNAYVLLQRVTGCGNLDGKMVTVTSSHGGVATATIR